MNSDWFYSVGDTRQGPVTEDELKRLVADGQLKPTDLVWRDGMADWVEARTVEALFPKPAPSSDEGTVRRKLDGAFDDERPSRRGKPRDDEYEDDDRPSRRSRSRDDDDDRPSRRSSRARDDDDDDDRPPVRRAHDDDYRDDYDDRPRRRRGSKAKPGQVQAVGIMLLVGAILGLLTMASVVLASFFACCLWPGIYFELVWAILAIIRAINMLNQDDQGPPKALAICQIIMIVNGDIVNCVLGIVCLVMLGDEQVRAYYRKRGFYDA